MKKILGFTLTETLVMVGIIGIIAVITFSSVSETIPNREKMLVIKCHKEISEAVQALLNDETLYPNYELSFKLDDYMFARSSAIENADDTSGYTTIEESAVSADVSKLSAEQADSNLTKTHKDNVTATYNEHSIFKNTSIPSGATAYEAKNKFSYNFAKHFVNTPTVDSSNKSKCTFKTADGVSWTVIDYFTVSSGAPKEVAVITIDVNGTKSGGVYTFTIDAGGKITPDSSATSILKNR